MLTASRKTSPRLCAAAASVALAIAAPAHHAHADTLLSDFETGDAQGWQNWQNPRIPVADPSGASSYMLKLDIGQQNFAQWVLPNWANASVSDANINAGNRLEFDAYFPSANWSNASAVIKAGFESVSGENATPAQTITVTPNTKQHITLDYASLGTMPFPAGDWLNLNLYIYPGPYTAGSPTYPQSVDIDNVKLTTASVPEWRVNADGNWSAASNWTSLPNGVGMTAKLGTNSGAITGARSVHLTSNITLTGLTFDNPAGYTIDHTAANALTLDAPANLASATVSVSSGNHAITAPLVLAKDAAFYIHNAASTLTLTDLRAQNITLTKAGAGTLEVNHLANVSVAFHAGTLRLAPNASTASTITSIEGGGKLDITNDKLVITNAALGSWNGSLYTGVLGLVRSGRNNGSIGGNWTGNGIVTSQSAATGASPLTTIAVARADETGYANSIFAGVSVAPSDVLVMYTYAGDANLSGHLDADDYFAIDSHYNKPAAAPDFAKGDFNYDGTINGDDYFIIDSAFAQQGATFASAAGPVAPVPEPTGLVIPAILGSLLRGGSMRRRMRSGN